MAKCLHFWIVIFSISMTSKSGHSPWKMRFFLCPNFMEKKTLNGALKIGQRASFDALRPNLRMRQQCANLLQRRKPLPSLPRLYFFFEPLFANGRVQLLVWPEFCCLTGQRPWTDVCKFFLHAMLAAATRTPATAACNFFLPLAHCVLWTSPLCYMKKGEESEFSDAINGRPSGCLQESNTHRLVRCCRAVPLTKCAWCVLRTASCAADRRWRTKNWFCNKETTNQHFLKNLTTKKI